MVTRSPNHSCAIHAPERRPRTGARQDAVLSSIKKQALAVKDRAGIFHRSGGKIRRRHNVELSERIFDSKYWSKYCKRCSAASSAKRHCSFLSGVRRHEWGFHPPHLDALKISPAMATR